MARGQGIKFPKNKENIPNSLGGVWKDAYNKKTIGED